MVKDKLILNSTDNFVFSAIRGIQADREYYIVMCPLKLIPRIFLFNESEIPPKLRAQRVLNKSRIPEMTNYITNNRHEYVFSSITASIDGRVQFMPVEPDGHLSKMGTLLVPMDAKFLINDGQHRRAAIENALKVRPELGSETISVVFYLDRGLKHSQQMFSDLNKHAVRPTTSLNILYDHRDEFARTLMDLIQEIPIFANGLTEVEKTSISNRANKVFTLNSVYNATKELLGKATKKSLITDKEKVLVKEFWNEIYNNIREWQNIVSGNITPFEVREKYVHVYGIVLHALGKAGYELMQKYPDTWKSKLKVLSKIDWARNNTKVWRGRMLVGNKISKSRTSISLTTNYVKTSLGLKLNNDELNLEKKLS